MGIRVSLSILDRGKNYVTGGGELRLNSHKFSLSVWRDRIPVGQKRVNYATNGPSLFERAASQPREPSRTVFRLFLSLRSLIST